MDAGLLEDLFPSLLIFSFVAFSFIFALPRVRDPVRTKFEQKLTTGELRWTEFFSFTYYLQVTKYLDPLAVLYLGGTFLVLLSILDNRLCLVAFAVIFITTTILLARFGITLFIVLRQALESLEVTAVPSIHIPPRKQ